MVAADLNELLRCPLTLQRLHAAGPAQLAAVNARRMGGSNANRDEDASAAVGVLDAALIREDGTALYPVVDGIPVLLPESVILL